MSWYDREHWYRMPEREKETIPAPLQVGDEIVPSRVIVRCGYYYEYTEAPTRDLNEIAIEIMADRLRISQDECFRIVVAMEYGKGLFSWEREHRPLSTLYYQARKKWVYRQERYPDTLPDYRTFWYVDMPPKEDDWLKLPFGATRLRQVLDKRLRMIGTPDVEYEYGEFGSEYCVGTFFNEHGRQTLYEIANYAPRLSSLAGNWRYSNDKWYVHPLDCKEVRT